MIKIKNCGLTTPESIRESAHSGATFIGFVHHEASPRHLSINEMSGLIAGCKHLSKTVAVLVNPSDDLLDAVARTAKPDFIQLHNVSSVTRIRDIGIRYGLPIITAISVRSVDDLAHAADLEAVSAHVLFDAKHPGGGMPFDWKLLRHVSLKKEWFLAGGLTQHNVADALRITRAPMVDVSSGIEDAPGIKSLEKIATFNKAVLHAAHG